VGGGGGGVVCMCVVPSTPQRVAPLSQNFSTSPLVEPPTFVAQVRRNFAWIASHPHWREVFSSGAIRVPLYS
jgi:hypothetical protein